jgi:hypothetical protein
MEDSAGKRDLLRHTLATLGYRGAKALRGAPEGFGTFRAFPSTRTPGEILAHLGDLLDWGLSSAKGRPDWKPKPPRAWAEDVARFETALRAFDAYLASAEPLGSPSEKLFQGPIADALTHVGQINMLRRMAGAAVRGENYFVADIETGRVGADQAPPRREFD